MTDITPTPVTGGTRADLSPLVAVLRRSRLSPDS